MILRNAMIAASAVLTMGASNTLAQPAMGVGYGNDMTPASKSVIPAGFETVSASISTECKETAKLGKKPFLGKPKIEKTTSCETTKIFVVRPASTSNTATHLPTLDK